MKSILVLAFSLVGNSMALLDSSYPRSTSEQVRASFINEAPQIPFVNFSAAYVKNALATPIDYTALGAVTPAKNQGPHGYCGTFGRMGSAEGQWALRSGKGLRNFSEEMLIDCIGWDKDQFSYFSPRGMMSSEDYPYNLSTYPDADPPIPGNPCEFNSKKVIPGTMNFFNFSTGRAPDEDQLAAFIHHNGPVSAGIGAGVFALRAPGCEERGDCFINATSCATVNEIDHSITVVGYGTDPIRGDYWIIKNSWSTKFANNGFINIQRGVGCAGFCGDPTICGNVFGHGDPKSYFN
jgi:Papain family cysteine protease